MAIATSEGNFSQELHLDTLAKNSSETPLKRVSTIVNSNAGHFRPSPAKFDWRRWSPGRDRLRVSCRRASLVSEWPKTDLARRHIHHPRIHHTAPLIPALSVSIIFGLVSPHMRGTGSSWEPRERMGSDPIRLSPSAVGRRDRWLWGFVPHYLGRKSADAPEDHVSVFARRSWSAGPAVGIEGPPSWSEVGRREPHPNYRPKRGSRRPAPLSPVVKAEFLTTHSPRGAAGGACRLWHPPTPWLILPP